MAYTTYGEVAADFKDITFSSTTNVTDADVTQFIVESDALINSYVGTVYQVPVITGDGLNVLKLLSRSLVASRIKAIMEVKQAAQKDANQNIVSVLMTYSQVMKALQDIQNKTSTLAGATLLESNAGFFSNNVANNVCSVMKKDTAQW